MERSYTGLESDEALAASANFYRQALGVQVVRRVELAQGHYAMNDLARPGEAATLIEMIRERRRNGCRLAYVVPDIRLACRRLQECGAVVCLPALDGNMASVCSPDGVPAELIQGSPQGTSAPAAMRA
jgi:lactoylglutathione lyase